MQDTGSVHGDAITKALQSSPEWHCRFLEILLDIVISLFAESHSDVTYFGVSCEEFRRWTEEDKISAPHSSASPALSAPAPPRTRREKAVGR